MREIYLHLKKVIRALFNLNDDKAEENQIVESIKRDVSFRGTNLWTLIFAIFIASIGLNMNATAVIIGAMLISPLMGPIKRLRFDHKQPAIELLLMGEELGPAVTDSLIAHLPLYNLKKPNW